MSSEIAITAAGLGKAYALYHSPVDWLRDLARPQRRHEREFWALRDLDLTVRRGEAVGIIGRNGSGKSTLLQLACGTLWPSTGTLEVKGRVAALLELGAGFNPEFTGRENVHLNASVLGLTDEEIAARLPAIEAFAGIGTFIDRPVREYSSGMYARLAFAVIAHVDADILIIDEILAVGDFSFQQKCMRYLQAFRERGTLLFVSHDERAVLSLCERAVWLDGGRAQAAGPAREVCRAYATALAAGLVTSGTGADGARPGADVARDPRWHGHNPIEISDFDPQAPWHGHGGAVIENAGFFTPDGLPLQETHGGNEVELRIACRAEKAISRPIVGYILRNAAGENICGDNTYIRYSFSPRPVVEGQSFTAVFRMRFPYLPAGDYFLAPSVVDGTQSDHYHVVWMENAVHLAVAASPIQAGAVGVPMREIRVD